MDEVTIKKNLLETSKLFTQIDPAWIHTAGTLIKNTIAKNNKLLICGNGGSSSQADHCEAELVGRYSKERRPLPCISLNQSSSVTTCIVNDYGGQFIFSRGVQAHGNKGDILLVLTTSGNSPNIIEALHQAKKMGIATIALLGKDGGKAKNIADHCYIVPSNSTARIQEVHIHIIHALCEYLEEM